MALSSGRASTAVFTDQTSIYHLEYRECIADLHSRSILHSVAQNSEVAHSEMLEDRMHDAALEIPRAKETQSTSLSCLSCVVTDKDRTLIAAARKYRTGEKSSVCLGKDGCEGHWSKK